jgi:hypothetical protein
VHRELREVQLQELGQEPRVQKVKQSLHQVPFRSIDCIDCEWKKCQFMLMVSVKMAGQIWICYDWFQGKMRENCRKNHGVMMVMIHADGKIAGKHRWEIPYI